MTQHSSETIVQLQLEAYNAKDIDALLRTYAADAEIYTLHGECLAVGHQALRARFTERFTEPNLHARLVNRMVMGNLVIDQELVTRDFPQGPGSMEMLCVYEVKDGAIQKASFAVGEKILNTP